MKFRTISILILLFMLPAATAAAVSSLTWSGTKSLPPKSVEAASSAIYNGKVYLFGGLLYDTEQNSTLVYDPASDAWTTGTNMPTARYFSSAAEAGGKIYVIGGAKLQSGSSVSQTVCEVYDPSSDSWTTAVPLPAALRGHSAVSANGNIYVLGGKTGSTFNSTVYEFDTGSGSWSSFSTAPFSSAYGAAVFSSSENAIYYIGGLIDDSSSAASYLGKAYSMNASSGAWESDTYAMPFPVSNFGAAMDPSSGLVYLVGGVFYSGGELPFPDIQIFDTSSHMFMSGTLPILPSPQSRYNSCSAVVSGKLCLVSGAGVNMTDVFNIPGNSWYQPNSPMNEGGSEVYNAGGAGAAINGNFVCADGGFFLPLTGAVHSYAPAGNAWTLKDGSDLQPRTYSAFGEHDGKLVIAGGMDGNANVLNTVSIYDSSADSFSLASGHDPYPAIFSAGAVYNGSLYL
ncbi:MAG TPA: kelch repeat-containing protein, partial [Acidobacteriota bacterium]|nr:kelch repeat-containing protein [Acidobacteriota bacterium]